MIFPFPLVSVLYSGEGWLEVLQSKYGAGLQTVQAFQGLCTEQHWCPAAPTAGLLLSGCSSPLSQNLRARVNLSLHPKKFKPYLQSFPFSCFHKHDIKMSNRCCV